MMDSQIKDIMFAHSTNVFVKIKCAFILIKRKLFKR